MLEVPNTFACVYNSQTHMEDQNSKEASIIEATELEPPAVEDTSQEHSRQTRIPDRSDILENNPSSERNPTEESS